MLFAFEDNAEQGRIMKVLFPAFLSIQGPYLSYTGKGNEGLEVVSFLVCCFECPGNNGHRIMHFILHGWVLEDLNREKEVWKYCVILIPNESSDTETLGSSVQHILFFKMTST